jgi:opacity protein-like surface antigen
MLSYPIPHSIVTPYIGVGVGGANVVFDTGHFSNGVTTVSGNEDDTVFAWQAFAGLRFQLNSRMSFGIGYKYFATKGSSFSYPPAPNFDVGFQGVRTHSVLLTFQMNFW